MNIIKKFGSSVLVALVLGLIINQFAFTKVVVSAAVLSEYKQHDVLVVNKLTKTFNINDVVVFNNNNQQLIRKIVEINNNEIKVSDISNNILIISKDDIFGKVSFKIY
jgi:signal peptidase I